jgi:hypothetical protein
VLIGLPILFAKRPRGSLLITGLRPGNGRWLGRAPGGLKSHTSVGYTGALAVGNVSPCGGKGMKYVVWMLVVVLIIAHQDNWLWENDTLVFGFVPAGLAFHMAISLAAGFTWWLATLFAWPAELEEDTIATGGNQ